MALVKQNIVLESVQFTFGADGNVTALYLNRTLEIGDDAILNSEGKPTSIGPALRDAPNVWGRLTAVQQTALNAVAKRLSILAGTV